MIRLWFTLKLLLSLYVAHRLTTPSSTLCHLWLTMHAAATHESFLSRLISHQSLVVSFSRESSVWRERRGSGGRCPAGKGCRWRSAARSLRPGVALLQGWAAGRAPQSISSFHRGRSLRRTSLRYHSTRAASCQKGILPHSWNLWAVDIQEITKTTYKNVSFVISSISAAIGNVHRAAELDFVKIFSKLPRQH